MCPLPSSLSLSLYFTSEDKKKWYYFLKCPLTYEIYPVALKFSFNDH